MSAAVVNASMQACVQLTQLLHLSGSLYQAARFRVVAGMGLSSEARS
jgi:hypothetical protein